MGARAALVLVTTFVATTATTSYGGALAGHPPAEVEAALARLREFLVAIGTPGFPALIAGTPSADLAQYGSAYSEGVRIALLTSGVGALVASVIAGIALGPRDPLKTVWEHQDERPGTATATTAAPPSSAGPVASRTGR
jgi:hypothetical protein